jgi:hypothetical protein
MKHGLWVFWYFFSAILEALMIVLIALLGVGIMLEIYTMCHLRLY